MYEPGAPVIVIAVSGRALAHSARGAGVSTRVIDLFGDVDTRLACQATVRVDFRDYGFDSAMLHRALRRLDPQGRAGVVYGSGFEAAPRQLADLARQRTLLGNTAETVARANDPPGLARVLERLGIPHPEIRVDAPPDTAGWLHKRAGGCGGTHVHWARAGGTAPGSYFQRHVPGRDLSVTVVGGDAGVVVAGCCEQWSRGEPVEAPFTYAGAITLGRRELDRRTRRALGEAARAVAAELGLRGLCSLDFRVDGTRWWLIEVNPRPGATFELHERETSLFRAHLQGVQGESLPSVPEVGEGCRGHRVVYADGGLRVPGRPTWPGWVSDRPRPGARIPADAPVCTVHAGGPDGRRVRAELDARAAAVTRRIAGWGAP